VEVNMCRRIYWLLPNLASALQVKDDLLKDRVDLRHQHYVTRRATDPGGVLPASQARASNMLIAGEIGLLVGALVGSLLAGGVLLMAHNAAQAPPAALFGLIGFQSAVFGAWGAGLIGMGLPNRRVSQCQAALDAGQVLLMVDVPVARAHDLAQQLCARHPEALLQGEELHLLAFL
jgi:hypothetical protein